MGKGISHGFVRIKHGCRKDGFIRKTGKEEEKKMRKGQPRMNTDSDGS